MLHHFTQTSYATSKNIYCNIQKLGAATLKFFLTESPLCVCNIINQLIANFWLQQSYADEKEAKLRLQHHEKCKCNMSRWRLQHLIDYKSINNDCRITSATSHNNSWSMQNWWRNIANSWLKHNRLLQHHKIANETSQDHNSSPWTWRKP